MLVPTTQFENFLSEINEKLHTRLTIPTGGAGTCFHVVFPQDGTPRPRYFGESTSKEYANQMKTLPPPCNYNPDKGLNTFVEPDEPALVASKKKIDALLMIEKQSKTNKKAKKQEDRALKQQALGDRLHRVQRYLGLREKRAGHHQVAKHHNVYAMDEGEYDVAIAAALANPDHPKELNVNFPSIFSMEDDLIFVCVDVEANERNHSQITEIGIATLDTRDITLLAPDEGGKNWFSKIRPRHIRIQEYSYIRNQDFVQGCPDRFDFG